ncbi:MAG TPA: nucleotide exchange factor GrpE [Pyrinomonadaceae bacterium]|jgi:molecular chaperone GrpE
MNTNDTLETANDHSHEPEPSSVDDFIRELEHLEQDLHITAELKIEVSESEFDDSNLPGFIVNDLKGSKPDAASAAKTAAAAPPSERLKREVTELEGVIEKFKAERKEILEFSQRQSKDFENFKRRTERERHERLSVQMENLAVQMLPVLDNLDRAVDFAAAMDEEKRAEIEPFIDGIMLVHRQVHDVLATMGVQRIVVVGREFDPHFHEAVALDHSGSHAPNTVIDELLRGYQMGSRVIRHAMVKVSAASDRARTEQAADEQDPRTKNRSSSL